MANTPSMADLEVLMDSAWPAPQRLDTGEWVLRAASGVTQRANSVWPRESAANEPDAVRAAVLWYRNSRLPAIYQLTESPRHESLNEVLDREGYTRQSETLVMHRGPDTDTVGPGGPVGPAGPMSVEVLDRPSQEWLRLWWSVDGRGGEQELAIARGILTGCPALYALVRDDDGVPAAVGRLALVDGYGGLYCMATRPDARRQGFARRIIGAMISEGSRRGLSGYWLMVTASNTAGQQLYRGAGFTEAGRYLYRQERPKRSLTGC